MGQPVYMDYHATTPVDQRVLDVMLPFFSERFGNVASMHCYGNDVRTACDRAREQVSQLLGCESADVVFTSGATESNNMAIKGFAFANADRGRHIITCVTEHKCVLDSCAFLEKQGFEVTYLPVDSMGRVSLADVQAAVRRGAEGSVDRTIMICLMAANNEIGTIHPIAEIGEAFKDSDIAVQVDAAQAAGKISFDVRAAHVDFASVSGHKMYAPKGIGALIRNRGSQKNLRLEPLLHGGGQEGGLRAGTVPVPLIVGLGEAARLCCAELREEKTRLAQMRDRLERAVEGMAKVQFNGDLDNRLPGNSSCTFCEIDGEMLRLRLKELAISSTSACSSTKPQPSHVLSALGLNEELAFSTIRFGLGRMTTDAEIDRTIEMIGAGVSSVARLTC